MRDLSRRGFLSAAMSGAAVAAGSSVVGCGRENAAVSSRRHFAAIVVGSGYGGGVSALRLAEAGVDTLVLEMGRWWNDPDDDGKRFSPVMPPDNRAGWFTDKLPCLVPSYKGVSLNALPRPLQLPIQAGICDKATHGSHNVFRGVAVGGGSMINAAIAAIPTQSQVCNTFPDIDADEFLRTYVERAKSALRISYRDMPWFEQTPWFQYARVGRDYATAAGFKVDYNGSAYSFDYMKQEESGQVPRSAFAREQQYGNNYGRFGSVDQTYLAAALRTGRLTLQPLTEVTDIRRERSGEYVVSTRRIDRWGKELARDEFGCDQLYLAAGVLGTVKLLLRARDTGTLSDLSEEIGRGYGNNGDIMVAHNVADADPVGIDQSLLGLINLDNRDDPINPAYASIFALPLPVETHALGYYAMVKTGDRADISYNAASDAIDIAWPTAHTDHLWARAQELFDRVLQANGVDYRDDLFEGSPFAPNTVHPLGGCIRGKATDGFGRVKGYDNLYVNDASLIPGYLGCNPFISLTALAERNIEGILNGRN